VDLDVDELMLVVDVGPSSSTGEGVEPVVVDGRRCGAAAA
jgi:hypothetical protein